MEVVGCAIEACVVGCVQRFGHLLTLWMGNNLSQRFGWVTPSELLTRLSPRGSFIGVRPRAISVVSPAVCGANWLQISGTRKLRSA